MFHGFRGGRGGGGGVIMVTSVYVYKTTCKTFLENNRKSTLTLKLFVNSGQNSTPIHVYCT
jgi:hypothetical protein